MSTDDRGLQQWAEVGQWQQLYSHTHRDMNMKLDQMLESKYLKQSDIDGERLVTVKEIKKVNVARDDEAPEYKWTILFAEYPKPFVANSTNLKRMFKYLGDDTIDWLGKQIVIFVDPDVEYGGKTTGGLRVRESRAAQPAQATRTVQHVDGLNDDVPF